MFRAGDLVELSRAESFGLAGTVAGGTKGVILREPGLMSKGYLVRLDPAGRQVELPADALRRSGGVLSSPSRSTSEAPWWRRQAAPGQKPKALGEKVVEETPRRATPDQPTPRQLTPRPPTTSTWRSAGPPARRAALSAHRPGTAPQRRGPGEAVAELRRRLGRPARPGGTPPA